MQILLRSICFVLLPAVPSAASSTFDDLDSSSSMHSIGVEWDITGDSNHNAEGTVQFRPAGTPDWKFALPLMRVDFQGENMLTGSILFLDPGTTYEVKLDVSDPDGGSDSQTLTVSTRPVPVPASGGSTLHVVPGAGGGNGSSSDPFQGHF